ncbi:Uncharacterised protein [Bordetella pertussis]|nr:Uncharacterised protein [Bordetella pertussis]CFO05519.1 Uncharacterised protein [Bordetella pertussis]CFU80530.1 Uncharacterised protein [Bordetella pertussis]CPH76804.1 Uncharacterised protein [Bordetella pertussis]CPK49374.1 Uncharacterised protein [Bordetella pertussis]
MPDARNAIETFVQQPLVIARIAYRDAYVVIVIARDQEGFQHFGDLRQRAPELVERFLAVAFQRDMHDDGIGKADAGGVDVDRIAAYDAGAFHALDAIPARGGRQADRRADIVEAGARVVLQGLQNRQIELVQFHFLNRMKNMG